MFASLSILVLTANLGASIGISLFSTVRHNSLDIRTIDAADRSKTKELLNSYAV